MSYESYQSVVKTMRDEITEKRAFTIIEQHGPRNDAELKQQTFKYYQLFLSYFFSTIHGVLLVGVLLLTGYGIELADTSLPKKFALIFDIAGTLIFILAIYYSIFGGEFQAKFLFRAKNLLSIYRKISFMEGYPMYATLGMALGFALAFMLSREPGVLLPDYESSKKTIIQVFGTTYFVGSFSCVLRAYFLEPKNSSIVLSWIMKWEESQALKKLKN